MNDADTMSLPHEFMQAALEYQQVADTRGARDPATVRAMLRALDLAPNEVAAKLCTVAQDAGLMPEADGYLDDGTPLYRPEVIAEYLGVSLEEVQEGIRKMMAQS